jgi:hypothetical protein
MKKLADPWDHLRRSVYILSRRNYHLTELDVFDQPQIAHNCTRRRPSAVVQQSLTMLNGQFIFEQSERFAERVMARTNTGPDARIATAFRLALIRTPTETERVLANDLLTRQASRYRAHQSLGPQAAADAALVDLCHMLFNTNEFLYLE